MQTTTSPASSTFARRIGRLALSALAASLFASPAAALPGDPDPTFGDGGFTRTNIGLGSHALIAGAAIQPDGKIVAVGSAWTNAGVWKVVRFHTDGTLDTDFGDRGIVTTEFGSGGHHANAVAIDADGKIVVAGSSGSSGDFALARYESDGSLDSGFGVGGLVTTPVGTATDEAYAMAIQGDGKIVVAGRSHNGVNAYHFGVVRYLATGALDNAFSGDGKFVFSFGPSTEDVNAVAVDPITGRILVAGGVFNGVSGVTDFGIARLTSGGSLDNTFSGDGRTTTAFGTTDTEGRALAIQSDSKVVLVGGSIEEGAEFPYDTVASTFGMARYNTDGTLDSSFGVGGKVTTDVNNGATLEISFDVVIQSDGKLVVAGTSGLNEYYSGNITVMRYGTNGVLDPSFNGDGIAVTDLGVDYAEVGTAVALQDDGMIVVAGYSGSDIIQHDAVAVRYDTNGSLDPGFGGDGIVTTTIGPSLDYARAVAVQDDGKVLVAGKATLGSRDPNEVFTVARYGTDGELDAGFGASGIVTTDFSTISDSAEGIAVQDDGKIVVVGTTSPNILTVVRYNPDGSLDASFSGDGKASIANAGAFAVVIQDNGKIVVAGRGSGYQYLAARFNTDGTLDTGFGGDGIVSTSTPASYTGRSVAIDANGKIVIAGGGSTWCILIRYNTDGSPDTTFDGDGKVETSEGESGTYSSGCFSVAIDGTKIVAAGSSYNGTNLDFAVFRYNDDGSLDTTLDTDGIVTTDVDASIDNSHDGDILSSISVGPDGRIIGVGSVQIGTAVHFAVVRYDTDGSLDTDFEGDGLVITDFESANEFLVAGALGNHGNKLVVAGTSVTARGEIDFVVGRYLMTRCGDGSVQAPEICDDANYVSGDGCDDNCTPTGCGNGVVTAGEECDDENLVDTDACLSDCVWNVCGDGFRYAFLEACDDGGLVNDDGCSDTCMAESACGFEPLPEASCFVAAKVQFQLHTNPDDPAKDQLKWKWQAGDGFLQEELGDPSVDDGYTLCVYDTSSGLASLATWAYAAPGPLWVTKDPKGWSYKDKLATSDGVQSVSIKTGSAARTKAQLVARGASLRVPAPFSAEAFFEKDPSVVVQLLGPDGLCFTSEFATARRNDGKSFKAMTP